MLLFYIRHGHPTYNPDCLTEVGFQQAEALVPRMKRVSPDKIFSSTSTRAFKTAEPTAKALGKEIIQLDWCHERHAWQQLTVKKEDGNLTWGFKQHSALFVSKEIRDLDEEWYKHPAFAGTSFEAGIKRIKTETYAFLESLGYCHTENGYKATRPNEDRIALFAHAGFGLAFLSAILDIPYPQFCTHFDISYTGVTVIDFPGTGTVIPKILQHSNDSHLFASGLDTAYNNYHRF